MSKISEVDKREIARLEQVRERRRKALEAAEEKLAKAKARQGLRK